MILELDGAAGEVSHDSPDHRGLVPRDVDAEPLDRVAELRGRLDLPSRDRRRAPVLLSFVDDDRAVSKALGDGLGADRIRGEVGRNGCGQIDGFRRLFRHEDHCRENTTKSQERTIK
jgi:hypothetical protein